jgi:hypothetical protein
MGAEVRPVETSLLWWQTGHIPSAGTLQTAGKFLLLQGEVMMKEHRCPKCGSESHIQEHLTVLVGIEDWPTASLFTAVVVVMGNYLAIQSQVVAVAILIAIAPLFINFFKKYYCDACEIDFRDNEEESAKIKPAAIKPAGPPKA